MFIYLSKKIAIPNNTKLHCISWNKEDGHLACGGDDGLLKVLRLDSGKDGASGKGLAAQSNLSMNQTLEGHNGAVQVVVWNEIHQKLTTSDQNGLIIVWMLYKGSWFEEMINNRNKSVVTSMAWDAEGQKICIVYEDGAVIVGAVDGNRLWGRDIKGVNLVGVDWSPDGKLLVFALRSGEVHVYDYTGLFVSKVPISCLEGTSGTSPIIAGLEWYDGRNGNLIPDAPSLAIGYQNGRLQIMKNERDEDPVVLDCELQISKIQWNHNGSVLAIAGCSVSRVGADKETQCMVQFYSPLGDLLHCLRLPGQNISACAWEGLSLRIALAVDSYIYFANIRPTYMFCYFTNTMVYAFQKKERAETFIMFWDTKNNERYVKPVKQLLALSSYGEHCVLATKLDDGSGQYGLILCNALGTPVDSKYIDLEPFCVAVTASHVFAASKSHFYVWHFRTLKSRTMEFSIVKREIKEKVYFIDNVDDAEPKAKEETKDPICCVTASDKVLIIARESGVIQAFQLPRVAYIGKSVLPVKPQRLALNCTSSKLSIIDMSGLLNIFEIEDLEPGSSRVGSVVQFERRDVWDMCWATDNEDLLAIMEKTRMYVLRRLEPEEPVVSSGYICQFKDLEIQAIQLDEVLKTPESPQTEFLQLMETKSLRDTRNLLAQVGIKEATTYVEENTHPRLWRLLAEAALQPLDLNSAESAFVRCGDYPGVKLVQRLRSLTSDALKMAEVSAYFGDFEQAEKLYLEADRRDLAIELYKKLGNWIRVTELQKGSHSISDKEAEEAYNALGDYHADRLQWEDAMKYYELAKNNKCLIDCYYRLEEFERLEKLVVTLPENHELLPSLGSMLASVGMCDQAVAAYIKCNRVKQAVDACILLNQWHSAVQLAKKYEVKDVSTLLSSYAQKLMEEDKKFEAVELFRKANKFLDAGVLLYQLADDEVARKASPMAIKKMYVAAALLVEEHRIFKKSSAGSQRGFSNISLDDNYARAARHIEAPWRGAEAFHFLLLAQRQLYEGSVDAAMKTALKLMEYEDLVPEETACCVLALASCANRCFAQCSKAFVRLEALLNSTEAMGEAYSKLAIDIFMKHAPKDLNKGNRMECPSCRTSMPDWSTSCIQCQTKYHSCVASGRPLTDMTMAWTCRTCHHYVAEQDIIIRLTCPLCHAPVQ